MRRHTFLLVLVIALAGCGGCGDDNPSSPSNPSASNRNPTVASENVAPTFGVAYLTSFTFSASATDPDGDGITYAWSFVDSTRGQIANAAGQTVQRTFPIAFPALDVKAQLTVADGRGGSATAQSVRFVVGSMTADWMVTSSRFPGVVLFYLRLTQDNAGRVSGQILDSGGNRQGQTDPAAPGLIDAQGRVSSLRLKFNSGADMTINGQMQPDGTGIFGTFSGNLSYNGVSLNGLPVTMQIG